MSYYYKDTNCIDHTSRLGFVKMPEGYALLQLDSGHFMWRHEESDDESCIHWNKWWAYRGARLNEKLTRLTAK